MKRIFLLISLVPLFKVLLFAQNTSPAVPQVYAMVVGISSYQDGKIPNLKFADKDAIAFADFLKTPNAGAVPDQNITLLTNEKATRSNILKALVQLISRSTKEDLLIFYFSGHGKNGVLENSGYLLTYDTENDNEDGTAASMDEIKNKIYSSAAKMKVSYIDACHAGLFTGNGKGTNNDNAEIIKAYLAGLANTSEGNVTFMASSSRQQSLEDEKLGHGIFTYYLIKGLQGEADKEQKESKGYDDGVISVSEMETYLSNKIQQATKYMQKPSVDGVYDEDFPLSILRSNLSLSTEIAKRPKKEKKTDKQDIVVPVKYKTPSDEKLSPGMTLSNYLCYGQYAFVNMAKNPLILIGMKKSKSGGGSYILGVPDLSHTDINISPGSTVVTPRLWIRNSIYNIDDCNDTFDDYLFHFKKIENGIEKYAEIRCTVESGKKKYLVLSDENLTFSDKKPLGIN